MVLSLPSMDASARRSFHVGRYHCVEALSVSPLGETFRAKVYGVAGLEKQYALNQIDASIRVDPARRSRLVDAARRWATLDHERVAKLTEVHDDADDLYVVSELARGIDVPHLLAHLRSRSESLPVEQAILVAIDIADALAIGQRAGVVHGGLVPACVTVLGEGEVRVGDFAISAALDCVGWATDERLVSVLAYTAPERLAAEASTAASDAWSVGALAYELCTGAPLYEADSVASLAVLRAGGPAWDKLPSRPGLREVLSRALADDPAARPATAAALREALAGILGLELGRARGGLQALVKRALGRALTRTGSFAAVAIPSQSLPTLVQDHPPERPAARVAPRTLQGMPVTRLQTEPPRAQERSWAPPRKTGPVPVVRDEPVRSHEWPQAAPTTQPGLGDPLEASTAPQHPALMEMAELPPSEPAPVEPRVAEPTSEAIVFDDTVATPHLRALAGLDAQLDAPDRSIDLVLEDDEVAPGNEVAPAPSARRITIEMTAEAEPEPVAAPVLAVPEPVVAAPPTVVAVPEPVVAPPEPAHRGRPGLWIGILLVLGTVTTLVLRESTPPPFSASVTPSAALTDPATPPRQDIVPPKADAPVVAGQVAVHTTPPGATVWLDGEDKGAAPVSLAVPAGTHRLGLMLPGFRYVEREVVSGATIDETLVPAKLPGTVAGVGGLKVRCHSAGEMRILVDGNDTGVTCPNDARINVQPGAHQIGLWSPRTGEIHTVDGEVADDTEHSTRIYVRY